MNKIASPAELQSELRRLVAYSQTATPSRARIAAQLKDLADRVAGEKKREIPKGEVQDWKSGLQRHKGKKGPGGITFGSKFKHEGKDWLVYDFDADSSAPGGSTLTLVSPDYTESVSGVKMPKQASVKTAVSVKDLKNPIYRTPVKVRGYNGKPTVMSAHGKDAGDVLIALQPDVTRAEHAQQARGFEALSESLSDQYSRTLDEAAQATWGRLWRVTDYKVSGIGSDEFSEPFKEKLRFLAHGMSQAKTIAQAHGFAAKSRRIS